MARTVLAWMQYILGHKVKCRRAPTESRICDTPHMESAGLVTLGFQAGAIVTEETDRVRPGSGLRRRFFSSWLTSDVLSPALRARKRVQIRSQRICRFGPLDVHGWTNAAERMDVRERRTSGRQMTRFPIRIYRRSTTSASSVATASSRGRTFCCLEPRRRMATERFSTSRWPTASSTGTLATLCSRTL